MKYCTRYIYLITLTLATTALLSQTCLPHFKQPQYFFQEIKPLVEKNNKNIMLNRNKLISIHQTWLNTHRINPQDRQFLTDIARLYAIPKWNVHAPRWQFLLSRVDIIPTGLSLAQAANESAFGRSRFAQSGCNLYGQWCFTKGCGLIPKQRPAGQYFEVKKFKSLAASIAAYSLNLNTHPAYLKFRQHRAALRQQSKPLSSWALLPFLSNYSARKGEYLVSLASLIQHYHLEAEQTL